MKVVMATFLIAFVFTGRALPAQTDKRVEQIEKERAKLVRETDPVDRTKIQIKISEVLLAFAAEAVSKGDFIEMQRHLTEYSGAIRDAHQTMMSTGRDAHAKSGGFKDLEIALRRQLRQLDDLAGAVTYDVRDPIEKARNEASDIRDELMKALFGAQSAATDKS
jgi:hypothetical protein